MLGLDCATACLRHLPLDLQPPTAVVVVGRLVTDAETGAGREHTGGDVHGEKFLEEKLGGVGDVDLRDARLVVAGTALVFALLELTAITSVSWK